MIRSPKQDVQPGPREDTQTLITVTRRRTFPSVVTVGRLRVVATVSVLGGVVGLLPLLRVTVTPGPAAPLIRPTVTWPASSAVPISELSVIVQPIASIPLAPASSAAPLLNNGRGVRGAFQIRLVFFVIFCESAGKHLFKIFNSFGSVSHSEIPKYSRQLH